MPSTDEILPNRRNLLIGDVEDNRPNSEAVNQRLGAAQNFINRYQMDYISFFFNGRYKVATGVPGYDGAYTCFVKSQIKAVQVWNAISGISGATEFDIHWINAAGVDQGSIFSTTPKIDSTSSDKTRGFRNLETGNDFTMAGVTLPVLSKSVLEEGETLYAILNNSMVKALNCAITLNIRPDNNAA